VNTIYKQWLSAITAWALLIAFAGCGGEAAAPSADEGRVIEPLVGVDTTKPLITPEEEAATANWVLVPFVSNGKWGYADTSGKVVIPPNYESAMPFQGSLTLVKNGKGFGVINKNGKEVIVPNFSKIKDCGCGVFGIQLPNSYALINKEGKRIDKGRVTDVVAHECHQDRLIVRQGKKAAFLNTKGEAVTEFEFDEALPFYNGVAPVRRAGDSLWTLINHEGKPLGTEKYQAMYPFVSGYGVGIKHNHLGEPKYGVIDSTGKVIVPFQFARIPGTFEGKFVACAAYDPIQVEADGLPEDANTWFIYDRQGNKTGETHYSLWDDFSEGLIVVGKEGKFGFADSAGTTVIPCAYDWANAFKNGLAWVSQKGRYGFIDKKGKVVIPLKYAPTADYIFMENDGAFVRDAETGEQFYVDRTGKEYRNSK
jgi:hypothetical protein